VQEFCSHLQIRGNTNEKMLENTVHKTTVAKISDEINKKLPPGPNLPMKSGITALSINAVPAKDI